MKKVLFAMMAAMTVFMVSCEPDNTVEIPTVSFAVQPVNTDGVFTLTLMTTGYNGTDPVTVPLTFSGNAEEGVDFFVSDEAFVVGGLEPVTTITVRATSAEAEGKDVTVSLEAPEGFVLGRMPSVTFTLVPVQLYVSFETQSRNCVASASVTVQTFDGSGEFYRVEQATTVTLEIDETRSTAVLGTNFEIEGGKPEIVVDANDLEGTLILNMIEPYDENHNTVVLDIVASDNIHIGTYGSIEITFLGSPWEGLDGEWVIKELITDQDYFIGQFFDQYYTGIDKVPVFNENDRMTFDLSAGTFTPAFESSFKDYFIGVSNINQGYYYNKETSGENFNGEVLLVELDNVNRYFSSSDVSEDKVAYVGVNFITDEETGEELLDFYVLDFVSHSFFPEMEEFGMYVDEKPTSPWTYLEMTFKRAE